MSKKTIVTNINKEFDVIQTLSNINRFSNLRNNREQTVADHSYRVAMLTMFVCDGFNRRIEELFGSEEAHKITVTSTNSKALDVLTAIRFALFHDVEEAFIGDIPYPYKNSKFYETTIESLFIKQQLEDNKVFDNYTTYILTSKVKKHFDFEFQVMKFCDMFDLVKFCQAELRSGNSHIIPVLDKGANVCLDLISSIQKKYGVNYTVKSVKTSGESQIQIIPLTFYNELNDILYSLYPPA